MFFKILILWLLFYIIIIFVIVHAYGYAYEPMLLITICLTTILARNLNCLIWVILLLQITHSIDRIHEWLPRKHSFLRIKISPINLVFESIIENNFYSQTSLVGLI